MKVIKILLVVSIVIAGLTKFIDTNAASIDAEEQTFVELLNDYRESLGRTELKISTPVTNGAEFFAQDFADHPDDSNVNIHIDTNGDAPEERSQEYDYYFLTENMGWGYETGQQMFDAWKASEGHRDNMINSAGRTIGIARVHKPGATKDGASTEWFWVMDISDEGVERLIGNGLKLSELLPAAYRKLTVTIKEWESYMTYDELKWAELKVYDRDTWKILDRCITDKNGECSVYVLGSSRNVRIKVAKFKGKPTCKFTIKGRYTGRGPVSDRKISLTENTKFEIRVK